MKTQLRLSNESIEFKNQSISELYLMIVINANAVSTANPDTSVDLSKVRASLTLKQGGKTVNGNMLGIPAVTHTYMNILGDEKLKEAGFASTGVTANGTLVRKKTTTVKEQNVLLVSIIDSPLVLKGDDCLTVNTDLVPDLFGSTVNNDSVVYLVSKGGTDLVQTGMELMYYTPINTDKSDIQYSISQCSYLALLDSGTSGDIDDIPFKNIDLNSRFYKDQFTPIDLLCDNILNVESSKGLSGTTYGSLILHNNKEGKDLYNVSLNLSVDTSKITSQNQWIATRGFTKNSVVAQRASKRNMKIVKHKLAIRGINS